ncbi:DUF4249 domain-containing protein [Larkinella insperata]|uniref:DUF4249 domain-containing protein n=1 Tax=Larkinella insperata TaxID=332158 RepID=A0ABW3QMH6_9BACT|nr:DUF4249 domain-containing protein [Larkinella insperata]
MRFSLWVLFAGLLGLMTACDSLINDVDPNRLPKVDGKIVVQCYLSPQDTLLLATVGRSRTVLGASPTNPVVIGNVKVILSEGSRSIELRFDQKMLAYTAPARAFPIEAGKTYQLRVELGNESVSASCTVPEPVPVSSVHLDSTQERSWSGGPLRWVYTSRMSWPDPANQANYYRVAGEVSSMQWITLPLYRPGQTTSDTIRRYVPMQSVVYFDNRTQYVSDLNQEGQSITSPKGTIPDYLNYSYLDSVTKANYGGNAPISQRPVTINLMLLHVDKNYYDYHRTLQQQGDVDENPFAEPVLISTNIQGGLGCFGAYNRSALTATLK